MSKNPKIAFICAQAMITTDVSDCLVAGNSARIIKNIREIEYPLEFYKKGEVCSWQKK